MFEETLIYSVAGNIRQAKTSTYHLTSNSPSVYHYDNMGRLSKVLYNHYFGNSHYTYNYDTNGNIKRVIKKFKQRSGTNTYNRTDLFTLNGNRVRNFSRQTNIPNDKPGTFSFMYNNNGNMINKGNNKLTLDYNLLNLSTEACNYETKEKTAYIWFGNGTKYQVECSQDVVVKSKMTYRGSLGYYSFSDTEISTPFGGGMLIYERQGEKKKAMLHITDHFGNVRIARSGSYEKINEYEPFGEREVNLQYSYSPYETKDPKNRWLFNGKAHRLMRRTTLQLHNIAIIRIQNIKKVKSIVFYCNFIDSKHLYEKNDYICSDIIPLN